ncbi:MAG: NHLP leader peptide family RiPP precursor [Spirochaetota bacterium]
MFCFAKEKNMEDKIKENRRKMAKVISKAWSSESFKEKLISNPRMVLAENGITVPADVELKVVEQTEKLMYIVIPFRPEDAEGGSWMTEDDAYDIPCIRCV